MNKSGKQPRRDNSQVSNAPINKFEGYYSFLSNDFPAWIYYEGMIFPSLNTAFQAARTENL